ncbi:MAG: cupin domain-containing protein [Candidatus Aenigmarchaeota archaeon]|nr:cupin domain-containing protein [Candidatus Aenigmarchaeota archaeon]
MKNTQIVRPPESRALKSGKVVLMPGEEVGEHVTTAREEVIIVLRGEAAVVKNGKYHRVVEGEAHYIKEGVSHNVKNLSDAPVEYVYVVSIFPQ